MNHMKISTYHHSLRNRSKNHSKVSNKKNKKENSMNDDNILGQHDKS